MNEYQPVKSIVKASELLRCLGEGIDRLGGLASAAGLSKGTTHRILMSLATTGLVMADQVRHRYHLGPVFLKLAHEQQDLHRFLTNASYDIMETLREKSRETVALHIPVGTKRMSLQEFPSPQIVKHMAGSGDVAPIYTAAPGKILLSMMDETDLKRVLAVLRLDPVGPNTVTSLEQLIQDIENARKNRYAISCGERIPGSACIAVPVYSYSCPLALSCFGPEDRIIKKSESILEMLKKYSGFIMKNLKLI